MKLIDKSVRLDGIDCHVHSNFSPDSASEPQDIVAAAREKGLRGFIITDHLDVGHWDGYIIDFDKYFAVWERLRKENPDLKIIIGLEIGYERKHYKETRSIVSDLPLEYAVNSVHYWEHPVPAPHNELAFLSYLEAIERSLDVDYEFSTVGHIGFLERYINAPMPYDEYKHIMDRIIKAAVSRGVMIEENTNAFGEMRQPRADFLRAYKAAGGTRPVLSSDAHASSDVGRNFDKATSFLNGIFGERE